MQFYLNQNQVRISTRNGEVRGCIYNIETNGDIRIITERAKLIDVSISDIISVKE